MRPTFFSGLTNGCIPVESDLLDEDSPNNSFLSKPAQQLVDGGRKLRIIEVFRGSGRIFPAPTVLTGEIVFDVPWDIEHRAFLLLRVQNLEFNFV